MSMQSSRPEAEDQQEPVKEPIKTWSPAAKKMSVVSISRLNRGSLSRINMRKKSFGFASVTGVRPMDRSSITAMHNRRPVLTYLPTYQLNPLSPFKTAEVEYIGNKVLDLFFTNHKYNSSESPQLALTISTEIMRKVKEMHYNRYRIICVVTIGQKRAQSYNNAIAFIWDTVRDKYVDIHRENTTVFIQVTVFGIYLD